MPAGKVYSRNLSTLSSYPKSKNARRIACAALSVAAVFGTAKFARAAIIDWDPGTSGTGLTDGSGLWDAETSDWSNGSTDQVWNDTTLDTADIGAGSTGTLTADDAVGVTVGAVTSNSGPYTLTGTPINLGNAVTTFTVNAALLSENNILQGTGGLTVTGSSATNTLQIQSGSNTYTGGTTLNGITVNIGKGENNAIATPFGAANNTLVLTGTNTINGSGSSSGGSISYATPYNITINGTTTINTGKSFTLEATGYSVSGAGTLIFDNSGTSLSNGTSNIKGAFGSGFTGTLETSAVAAGVNIRAFANGGSFLGVPNGIFDMEGAVGYTFTPQTNSGGNTFTYGALKGANANAIYAGGTAGSPTDNIGGLNLTTSYAGSIQGNNIVNVTGGVLTLTNSNTYTGATTIGGATNGTVILNGGSITASSTTVASKGTLAGNSGTVSQAAIINGLIAPGLTTGGIGTLDFGNNLTINGSYNDDIDAAGQSDLLSITGALNLGASSILNVNVLDSTSGNPYTIATYGGALTGTFATTNLPNGYSINYGTGSDSSITLVPAVPEPVTGTAAMIGLGGSLLMRRRRRNRA